MTCYISIYEFIKHGKHGKSEIFIYRIHRCIINDINSGLDVVIVKRVVRVLKDELQNLVDTTVKQCGGIDIVVANAGGPPPGRFVDTDDAGWDIAVQQNLLGTVRLMRAAIPGMRARGWGRIVAITSTSAGRSTPSTSTRPVGVTRATGRGTSVTLSRLSVA